MHNITLMSRERAHLLLAHAKINLTLDIRWRRPDGYHELDTILQRLALHDTIILESAAGAISLASNHPDLPTGPANSAIRAAELLRQEYGVESGVSIGLHKRIPVAAGLGGGSADAAAILTGLASFWRLPALPSARLEELARQLGADVPFFLHGPTARARGIGDILESVPSFAGYEVVLLKPPGSLSTADVYRRFGLDWSQHPCVDAVVRAMGRGDLRAMGETVGNALEQTAIAAVPEIAEAEQILRTAGAPVVLMSGSGPTVFGLSAERGWAGRAAREVARPGWTVIATRTA